MGKATFKILVSTETNPLVELPFHYNYLTNAVECARLYKKTPLVQRITVSDDFDVLWVWTPQKGETEMGKFATNAATRGNNSFVSADLKKVLARAKVPFTVLQVSGPNTRTFMNGKKSVNQDLYDLRISFSGPNYEKLYHEYGVNELMVVSFAAGYEGRDGAIEDIRSDINDGETVRAMITYNPDFGPQGWYDLTPAEE